MASNFTVALQARDSFGTSNARRMRRDGRVPVVVYGTDAENEHFCADHDALIHSLNTPAFHSAIIDLDSNGKKRQAILRDVQMHPHRAQVLHIDFQSVKATEQITINVPLQFIGDDVAPGVKTEGGIFSRLILDIEIQCLPADLPEFIEVDVAHLELNQSVHVSDIQLPEGVAFPASYDESDDYAIASVIPARVSADLEAEQEMGEELGLGAEEQTEQSEQEE